MSFSFSPDAKVLACVETLRTDTTHEVRCVLMNADGSGARELHRGPQETYSRDDFSSDRYAIYPRFARDGKTLALLCGSNEKGTFLLVGDGQGRNLRKLPAPKIP